MKRKHIATQERFDSYTKEKQREILEAKLVEIYRTDPHDPRRAQILKQLLDHSPGALDEERLVTRCVEGRHFRGDKKVLYLCMISDGGKVKPEMIEQTLLYGTNPEIVEEMSRATTLVKYLDDQSVVLNGNYLETNRFNEKKFRLLFPKLNLGATIPHTKHADLTVSKAIALFPNSRHLEKPFKELVTDYYELDVADELINELVEAKSVISAVEPWQEKMIENHAGWYNVNTRQHCQTIGFKHVESLYTSKNIPAEMVAVYKRYNAEHEKQLAEETAAWEARGDSAEYHYIENWSGEVETSIGTRLRAFAYSKGWIRIGINADTIEAEGSNYNLSQGKDVLESLGTAYSLRYSKNIAVKTVGQDKLIAAVITILKEEEDPKELVSAIESPRYIEDKINKLTDRRHSR